MRERRIHNRTGRAVPRKKLHRHRHKRCTDVDRSMSHARPRPDQRRFPAHIDRTACRILRPGRSERNLDHIPRPTDEENAQTTDFDTLHGTVPTDTPPRRSDTSQKRQPLPVRLHFDDGRPQQAAGHTPYRRPLPQRRSRRNPRNTHPLRTAVARPRPGNKIHRIRTQPRRNTV